MPVLRAPVCSGGGAATDDCHDRPCPHNRHRARSVVWQGGRYFFGAARCPSLAPPARSPTASLLLFWTGPSLRDARPVGGPSLAPERCSPCRRSLCRRSALPRTAPPCGRDPAPQAGIAAPAVANPGSAAAESNATDSESVIRLETPRTSTEIVKTYAKRVMLPPGLKWTDAGGFDENVVTVTAEDNTSLRLYAASPGVTQVDLLAVDAAGNPRNFSIDVLVAADARALQAAVDQLFPGTSVEVYGLTDTSVVLRGWITRPEHVSQIMGVAGAVLPGGEHPEPDVASRPRSRSN